MPEKKPPKGEGDPLGDRSSDLYPGGFDPLSSSNGYSSPKGLPENFNSLSPEEQQKKRMELLKKLNKGRDKL